MLVAGDRHVHLLYQVQQFAQYLQHLRTKGTKTRK